MWAFVVMLGSPLGKILGPHPRTLWTGQAMQIFECMQRRGMSPDVDLYNALISALEKAGRKRCHPKIPSPEQSLPRA